MPWLFPPGASVAQSGGLQNLPPEVRGSPEELWVNATIERSGEGVSRGAVQNDRYPVFAWSIGPAWRQSVGAPEAPFTFQLSARLEASMEFLPGLKLRGMLERDIYNNFDRLTRGTKGNLEPVRSNLTQYLRNSELPLVRLQGDYVFSPMRNVYAAIRTDVRRHRRRDPVSPSGCPLGD